MALQDSTVILSVRSAHAIWCGTTSSADRVP
ncbi:hypothetical protein T12_10439 [Trichinella patagoniensis]|uniref:Uncharacterized protein n=1 Tax=Trichinella patagoniensis TaxID=990121 RepID=A0A0V0YYI0_9BILA|nr:hypothetical protein T12_12707 [Trichinella patagoniensis]KRY05290.1 hypothetical protein T12_13550 [Trichinella patagoniensis]KRY05303.1 hypothetical protein T12_13298 [Trichinella patagoniensis]KRY05321.1 hypothetical protein T12_10439 [Trichinella patagoniensis]